MTDVKTRIHWRTALLVTALLPMPAFAQTAATDMSTGAEAAPTDQDAYGTAAETLFPVNAYDFEGIDSATTTGWVPFNNRRYRTGGANTFLVAGLNVPNGAQITKVAITGCDTDATFPLEGALIECPLTNAICSATATVTSPGGQPGCGTYTLTLPTPRTVNHSTTDYSLLVNLHTVGTTLQLLRMSVHYKLQVSPAPATARFTDVPVGHPLHRFVEALAASGITGGCSPSEYCPDAAITRGQMAVFLSVALGMHWPN